MNHVDQLLAKLNIQHPIVQAPMAGVSKPRLASEVSNADGLGSIATARFPSATLKLD